jgi:hypothetical protein
VPPYNRWERAILQAIQQAIADATDGVASFTWDELAGKASVMSGERMPADLARAYAMQLHRKGIIGIEYADEGRAEGVTMRRGVKIR